MSGQIIDATIAFRGWADKPAKLRQTDRDARWTVKFSKARPLGRAARSFSSRTWGLKQARLADMYPGSWFAFRLWRTWLDRKSNLMYSREGREVDYP
jgi:hypothetical protein